MSIEEQVHQEAQKSICKKRKVGAIIVDKNGGVVGRGHNRPTDNILLGCEDAEGKTNYNVVHAEADAIAKMGAKRGDMMYISHLPCVNCTALIEAAQLKFTVVEKFMKFDTGKLRYDLVPPSAMRGLAEVLTYGAKKYKPKNYLGGEEARFIAALYRHLEAWRTGEELDKESGMPHLWHALTNIAIIMELKEVK